MDITIVKNEYGSLFATDGNMQLFQFEYRTKNLGGPAWYFWTKGGFNPNIFKGKKSEFPMDFFKSACRALSFLFWNTDIDEEVNIVKGEQYLR